MVVSVAIGWALWFVGTDSLSLAHCLRSQQPLFPGLLALRDAAETLVAVGCLAGEKVDRQGWVLLFQWFFSLAISVSVSFDFSIGVLGKSLALARRAFLFSLRRR